MEKSERELRKKVIFNIIYATIIGLLIVACIVTIVAVNGKTVNTKNPTQSVKPDANIKEDVVVSTTTYVVPIKDATIAKDYSATELQYNETLKQWEIHKAIDFIAGENLDVFAITSGTVSNVYNNYLEGTVIEITHNNGLVSVYKSLEVANVSVGDKVNAGQVIGKVGNSMAQELNAGAHLHFELFENGVKINPSNYLDLGSK